MPSTRRLGPHRSGTPAGSAPAVALAAVVVAAFALAGPAVRGDTVVLKNGVVYRGTVDKDRPLYWVYDGLKRVVLYDSKVDRIIPDAALEGLEEFRLVQPLVVHGGMMPGAVVRVEAGAWNDRGRRQFAFEGNRPGKMTRMEQAINEMGPYMVKLRGVDGYWQGQLATSQVPREVVLAILAKVDPKDPNERVRVARFLIQAEWYAEARAALDAILKDFPGDAGVLERVTGARALVVQLEATQARAAIDRARKAQQFREVTGLLKTFPREGVGADLTLEVEELSRRDDAQAAADKALADDLNALAEQLPTAARSAWKRPLLEVLRALKDAPDAVRDRFAAWQKARDGAAATPAGGEALFALAMSGYVVGPDAAVDSPAAAEALWSARDQTRVYLADADPADRSEALARLQAALAAAAPRPAGEKPDPAASGYQTLDTLTRLAVRMPPPLQDDGTPPGAGKINRVRNDDNAEPTDYAVSLPPEYHPLRNYPTVVALHDGRGPDSAVAWWSAEATRRGYIVIAPQYRLPNSGTEYQYTTSEHAAVELALRDARRRYAVDGDRVFVGGVLTGANMAWDFGLAHPDLFAGVVSISGLPFKYVNRYLPHHERLPLYAVLGDLAPAANEVVFGKLLKPMIAKPWDVTYLEYLKRGLEDFPEEAAGAFDFMDRRRRDPYPKEFNVVTARPSDNRFFGVVVNEFKAGRSVAPAAVEPFGENLNPATIKFRTSAMSNLINVETGGLSKLDVWVSPRLIDFHKRLEVRVNRKPQFKGVAKLDPEALLEDLRVRGDRQQIYWMKVPAG